MWKSSESWSNVPEDHLCGKCKQSKKYLEFLSKGLSHQRILGMCCLYLEMLLTRTHTKTNLLRRWARDKGTGRVTLGNKHWMMSLVGLASTHTPRPIVSLFSIQRKWFWLNLKLIVWCLRCLCLSWPMCAGLAFGISHIPESLGPGGQLCSP